MAAGSISIDDVSIREGDTGNRTMIFTVTRTGGTDALKVSYATADDTATAGSDYLTTSGVLSFGAFVNSQTIPVTIIGDTLVGSDEDFFVNLSSPTNGATISDGQGVGTILNDDSAGSVSIGDVSISEGDSGTKTLTFTVTRSGGRGAFDVDYATTDGTATAGQDYVAIPKTTLSFGADENTKTVSVTINGDTTVEPDETFLVNLTTPTNGATIDDSGGLGTIVNDDDKSGSVSIDDVSISEGNSGTQTLTFTVTRSGGTAPFTVDYATVDGTARSKVAGRDYVATSDTLSFGASENTKTFSVTIDGDKTVEPDEYFYANLSNATNGATISDNLGVGMILNDDNATKPLSTSDLLSKPSSQTLGDLVDFSGNNLGAASSWVLIGQVDIQGDGDLEYILTNSTLGRWATLGPDQSGIIDLDNHGAGGDTRVVGIYIDPAVDRGEVQKGSPFDSQTRFQNDLFSGNIKKVLGAGDYNSDGLQEVYFGLGDQSVVLHAYMHADGNIQYANYQTSTQAIDYLKANGFSSDTWSTWF